MPIFIPIPNREKLNVAWPFYCLGWNNVTNYFNNPKEIYNKENFLSWNSAQKKFAKPVKPWPDRFSSSYINIPKYKLILSYRTLKLSNKAITKLLAIFNRVMGYSCVYVLIDWLSTLSTGACMWSYSVQ